MLWLAAASEHKRIASGRSQHRCYNNSSAFEDERPLWPRLRRTGATISVATHQSLPDQRVTPPVPPFGFVCIRTTTFTRLCLPSIAASVPMLNRSGMRYLSSNLEAKRVVGHAMIMDICMLGAVLCTIWLEARLRPLTYDQDLFPPKLHRLPYSTLDLAPGHPTVTSLRSLWCRY